MEVKFLVKFLLIGFVKGVKYNEKLNENIIFDVFIVTN